MLKQGYKQTEIGVIPEDWEVKSILDITENIIDYRGVTPKKLGMDWGNGDIVALSAGNVKKGYIDFNIESYLGSETLYKRWMRNGDAKKDDIVFTLEAPLGNVALIPDNKKYILSQRTILLQPDITINSKFVFQILISDSFQKSIFDKATGSTAQGIKRQVFEKIQIPLPPLAEQEAIATALSDADAWIDSLEQLIAKKRRIKQGAMQELLTPPSHAEPVEAWEVKKLGEVIETTQLGGNYQNSEEQNDYPLMKMGNLQRGFISLKKIEYVKGQIPSEKDLLKTNDLLFNTRNTLDLVGKVSIWRNELPIAYFNSNIMRICFNKKFIASNVFVNAVFNTKEFLGKLKDIATGTTSVAAIYTRDLFELEFSFPSLSEQERIATILSDMDAELEALETQLAKARQIKQGMMQELLTGRTRLV